MDKKNSLELMLEEFPIRFADIVIDGDTIWFSTCNFNGFFKGSVSNGSIEYIGKFLAKDEFGCGQYNFITKYEEKIFLGPTYSKYIIEYDISTSQSVYHQVPGLEQIDFPHGSLVGQFEKYLVIWNTKNVDVVRFDMKKKEFEEVRTCKDSILAFEEFNKKECVKFRRGFCIKDNSLFIVSTENNIILQVDVNKNEKKLHVLNENVKVHSICSDGHKLWITDACNHLLEWDQPTGKIKKYVIEDEVPIKNAYFSVCHNNCLYFALLEIDEVLIYHLESKKIESLKMYIGGTEYNGIDGFPLGTIMLKVIEDRIWVFNSTYSTLQYIKGNIIKQQKIELIGNSGQFILDRRMDLGQKNLCEDEEITLQEYLHCFYDKQLVSIEQVNTEKAEQIGKLNGQEDNIGQKIYLKLKKE